MFPTLTYPGGKCDSTKKSEKRNPQSRVCTARGRKQSSTLSAHINLISTWYSTGKPMHTRPCVCVQQNHFVFDTIGVFAYNAAALGPQCNAVIGSFG